MSDRPACRPTITRRDFTNDIAATTTLANALFGVVFPFVASPGPAIF